jgi:AAA15 family ATPase/GTPase
MLNSLEIRNYRNLKGLTIPALGKVNLITGKNNTGKSTILEAIAIYASKADLALIYDLLDERGEKFKLTDTNKNYVELIFRTWTSLFTDRLFKFNKNDAISIGELENTIFGIGIDSDKSVTLRFVKYITKTEKDKQGLLTQRQIVFDEEKNKQAGNEHRVGVEIWNGTGRSIIPIDDERWAGYSPHFSFTTKLQFIRPRSIDRAINGTLWDKITLTEKEVFVIDALKIIEPAVERIAFVGENRNERTAVIKLSGASNVVPLRSMGDGMNRILTIILAIINADNGFLLIDEFENGLHYTVQKQLWNIIFNLASKLNVQVFATTHSEDCIRSFESVLNDPAHSIEGKLIRLDNINGVIKQVEFDANELKIANSQNIETR